MNYFGCHVHEQPNTDWVIIVRTWKYILAELWKYIYINGNTTWYVLSFWVLTELFIMETIGENMIIRERYLLSDSTSYAEFLAQD